MNSIMNSIKSPIVLFTYNRPWHTKQTIEALWIEIDFAGFGPINSYTWISTIFINPEYRLKYYKKVSSVGGLIQLAEDDQECTE